MKQLVLVIVGLIFGSGQVVAQDSISAPTATLKQFLLWRDAVGLKDKIQAIEEHSGPSGDYRVALHVGALELTVDRAETQKLYDRLFLRLLSVTDAKPEKVELQIRFRDEWCDSATVQRTLRLNSAGIVRTEKILEPSVGIRCSLDFEAIRRYENETRAAVSNAKNATSFEP